MLQRLRSNLSAADDTEDDTGVATEDLHASVKLDLRRRLKELGLPMSGYKADMLQRLRDHREEVAAEAERVAAARAAAEAERAAAAERASAALAAAKAAEAERAREAESAAQEEAQAVATERTATAKSHSRCDGHVLVVLSGLMGSGKSSLCKLLGKVYPGTVWMNQDEIGKVRGAGKKFTAGVRDVMDIAGDSSEDTPRLLLVDKMNHELFHREGILGQASEVDWQRRGGRILLVELAPPDGQWPVDQLIRRIENRGSAHHTLLPSDELPEILRRTTEDWQPVTDAERAQFDEVLTLDIAMEAPYKAVQVATMLFQLGWPGALSWRETANYAVAGIAKPEPDALEGLPPWAHILPSAQPEDWSCFAGSDFGWQAFQTMVRAVWAQVQQDEEAWRILP